MESCVDLDVLLLLDTTDSMTQWLGPLAVSLPSLFSLFTEELNKVCSFHVGLATAEASPENNPEECRFPGALAPRPASCGGGDGVLPWLSDADGTPTEVFGDAQCSVLQLGTTGDDDERMLDALMGAIHPDNNAKGGCNEGFRRPGANLVVVYVSDEDDPTPIDKVDNLADDFIEIIDPQLVAFISVVGDPTNTAPECQWEPDGDEGSGSETPIALNGFLGLSQIPNDQQATVDICESEVYDFGTAFEVFRATCGG